MYLLVVILQQAIIGQYMHGMILEKHFIEVHLKPLIQQNIGLTLIGGKQVTVKQLELLKKY